MRTVTIPAVATETFTQDIHAYTTDLANKNVAAAYGVGSFDNDGVFTFTPGQVYNTTIISGQDFLDLMAANGGDDNLIPGKPAGTFRKEDLWIYIDRINARATL